MNQAARNPAAWGVLVVGLSLVAAVWHFLAEREDRIAREQFNLLANEIVADIGDRMRQHEQILLGGAGLFAASESVSRATWRAYVERLNLGKNSPGIQGVGFSKVIAPADLAGHIAAIRAEGFPDYTVRPPGERALYTSIIYLEPFEGRNLASFGYDMFSESTRNKAMRGAVDGNRTSITGKVKLVQETHGKPQAGFLMYVPIYRKHMPVETADERWRALSGFVYSPYRVADLMRGILGNRNVQSLDFTIHDGTAADEESLMYDSAEALERKPAPAPRFKVVHKVEAYGNAWTVSLNSRPAFEAGFHSDLEYAIPVLGIMVSGALFLLVVSLTGGREKALSLAKTMTAELATAAQTLRDLHAIASDQSLSLDDKIERTLLLGICHFGQPVGVVGEIADGIHTIRHIVGPDWMPEAGSTRPVADTFCSLVAAAGRPVAIADADVGAYRDHPASRAGVKSYIGAPLRVEGKLYGTLGFSGPSPQGQAFDDSDLSLIQMMAEWIGTLMGRRRQIERLNASNAELRDSENRLSAIFRMVVDGIITIDEQGSMETVNPAAEKLFGYAADEMIGRNVRMLMPEPYAGHHDGYLAAYRKTGEAKIIGIGREVVGKRKDGSEFPLDLAVSEVRIGTHRIFVGVVRDLTERKKIERLHKEFVSTVSHELRTPLTSIMGSLGLVRGGAMGAVPDKVLRLVDIAHANSDRLVRLINDILDIEKIESGKFEFRMAPVDLDRLAEQAIESNRGYAERLSVRLHLARAADRAMVFGDPDRLTQVMANLLSNAAKFSPPGGAVEVTLERQGDWARVSVRDHGPGIPANFREKVFGKFSQADASDSRAKGGTGLGLNITKAIVDRHGGRIWFEDGAGGGTVFRVELPCTDVSDRVEDTGAAPGARRVLVCEDDRDIASLLALILRQAKFAVDIAHTIAAAREMVAAKHYDALSLDLVLPDGDGIALIRELRADARTARLPVVVVSARAREGRAVINGHAVGVLDWLEKPVQQDRLLAALDTVFQRAADHRVRILHVEDDAATREVVAALIGGRAEVIAAATVAEARERLQRERFDLAILDLGLPDGSGKDLLPLLKPTNGAPATPVVVLSVTETDADLAGAVNAALVKTRTSNENILNTILSLIPAART